MPVMTNVRRKFEVGSLFAIVISAQVLVSSAQAQLQDNQAVPQHRQRVYVELTDSDKALMLAALDHRESEGMSSQIYAGVRKHVQQGKLLRMDFMALCGIMLTSGNPDTINLRLTKFKEICEGGFR